MTDICHMSMFMSEHRNVSLSSRLSEREESLRGSAVKQGAINSSRQKKMLQILCVNASNCCSEPCSGTDPCTV